MTGISLAAAYAIQLHEENDYSLRVACTYASRDFGMVIDQVEIYERAKELR